MNLLVIAANDLPPRVYIPIRPSLLIMLAYFSSEIYSTTDDDDDFPDDVLSLLMFYYFLGCNCYASVKSLIWYRARQVLDQPDIRSHIRTHLVKKCLD